MRRRLRTGVRPPTEKPGSDPSFDAAADQGPGYLALTALVFGSFSAVQIQIEGVDLPGIGSLIQMVPYVVTVVVLAGLMAKSVAPKAIGKSR